MIRSPFETLILGMGCERGHRGDRGDGRGASEPFVCGTTAERRSLVEGQVRGSVVTSCEKSPDQPMGGLGSSFRSGATKRSNPSGRGSAFSVPQPSHAAQLFGGEIQFTLNG